MKIIDSKLTTDDINNMNSKDFKNFERRLRWRVQTLGYKLSKLTNPFGRAIYYITDTETYLTEEDAIELNILEVRNWLYGI